MNETFEEMDRRMREFDAARKDYEQAGERRDRIAQWSAQQRMWRYCMAPARKARRRKDKRLSGG